MERDYSPQEKNNSKLFEAKKYSVSTTDGKIRGDNQTDFHAGLEPKKEKINGREKTVYILHDNVVVFRGFYKTIGMGNKVLINRLK